jgi:transposase
MSKRRKYDKEFKLMAVELSEAPNKNTKSVAEELGIRQELLCRWKREFSDPEKESFTGNGNPRLTEQEAEVIRLKKELKEAQMERDILKKAVSIFSRNDGKYFNS